MPDWLQIVLALGGGTILAWSWTSILNAILKNTKKSKEKKELEEEKKISNIVNKAIENKIDPKLNIIENKVDYMMEEAKKDKKATVLILRNNLKAMRDRYLEQGFVDTGDFATWMETYNSYNEMGGNHFKEFVDGWKRDIENLPVKNNK